MKITTAALMAFVLFIFTACKKQDHCHEPPKKDSTCDLTQSTVYLDSNWGDFSGLHSEFRKELNNAGQVRKVVAGVYTLRLEDSVALLLKYDGSTIYFLDEKNPADTFSTATFDSQNRLEKMTQGNARIPYFETTVFTYTSSRLSTYLVSDQFEFHVSYDEHGNVIHIRANYDKDSEGTFFTYDYTVQAKRQWYTDYFPQNGVSNSVYLAQFLGWLPDLEPTNKLVSWKNIYNDDEDDSTPPVIIGGTLTDHVFDVNRNLVSYKGSDATYSIIWSCKGEKVTTPN